MQKLQSTSQVPWHQLTAEESLERLDVTIEEGLSKTQARERLEMFGKNELVEANKKTIWNILWAQVSDTMVLILIAAAVISVIIGDWKDAIAIVAIVIINTIIGLVQEYRAEQAMEALKQMATPIVKVRRNGELIELNSHELVPGDIVLLETGAIIPADGRLVEEVNLKVEEASLTGESVPVDKNKKFLAEEDSPLGDRDNMVYMGTVITYGRGTAVITSTGMATELGKIAEMIQGVGDEQTPLQKRMDHMGKTLAWIALAIVAGVFTMGLLRGEDPAEMFLTSIAMAVAAIPEGLPAVVAIALALGAQRMLKKKALIRKLPAVETLGSVTVISSDKTGTLTANMMQVKVLDVAGNTLVLDVDEIPGKQIEDQTREFSSLRLSEQLLTIGGVLNNDAELKKEEGKDAKYHWLGDPTEGALLIVGDEFGIPKTKIEKKLKRVSEIPFSSDRKRMTTVHSVDWDSEYGDIFRAIIPEECQDDTELISFTKGAVDGLVEISDRVYVDGRIEALNDEWRARIEHSSEELASEGLRVLGVGFRVINQILTDEVVNGLEAELIYVGMFGMMDPPRLDSYPAVQMSQKAGIRTMMITGDHPLTAKRIARDLGISQAERIITGAELERTSDEELDKMVEEFSVYARVSPEHKLRIVSALQNNGEIVAMTGDGVNDAPALRKADIGVAMGITGTDVSKEASDMVLMDDNYATIVSAVKEGRTIFDNIRKFIKYTMTSNAGEIIVMLLAPLFGMPLPLTALQILWINLVTDGLPGLAMSFEPAEKDTMERPPHNPQESIFARGLGFHIGWVGFLMGLSSLGIGVWGWLTGNPYWATMVFTTLTLSQMGHALAIRSEKESLFRQGLFSNKPLFGAVGLTFVLQMVITYWEPLRNVFGIQAMPVRELLLSLGFSVIVFIAVEVEKWVKRNRNKSILGK